MSVSDGELHIPMSAVISDNFKVETLTYVYSSQRVTWVQAHRLVYTHQLALLCNYYYYCLLHVEE